MKKKTVVVMAGIMSLWLAACGQAGGTVETQTEPSAVETASVSGVETQTGGETEGGQTETPVQTETPTQTESAVQTETAASTETQPSGGYEDNFAVDSEAAEAFGKKIQDAVAVQDIEALADLTAYPVYVGFTDESVSAASREEFVALGAERIFTPELVESVENADLSSLSPSMAGFVLSADSKPNIIFGVVDGALAIQGINY
ncbi:MAG TPA: hypothetical protein H9717_01320 [Candidatus Eisenbergiella merdipullorum]|uniref:Uncharacterized protein n=1 Tax=Candidatus Eisenbergiella merdipullorum TaxID=2838553 RepID=A0A9D2L013_9FIRM|nr:hypothetical protein [Candidatus Eisenbergiella merdipullorum]